MKGKLWMLLVAAVTITVAAVWFLGSPAWRQDRQRREIDRLDPAVRGRLYQEHKREFDELCRREKPLVTYCSSIAVVLDAFPECDPACHEQIDRWLPSPTR